MRQEEGRGERKCSVIVRKEVAAGEKRLREGIRNLAGIAFLVDSWVGC